MYRIGVSTLFLFSAIVLARPSMAQPSFAPGFAETEVISNLNAPVAVRFSPDGRIFIAEKAGRVKIFSSFTDPAPRVLDLTAQTFGGGDRGLLGMTLHPDFPQTPYVYVLYVYDGPIGSTAPVWGDVCRFKNPDGSLGADIATKQGCVVSGRLSRFEVGDNSIGPEVVILGDQWCQQYLSHSLGDLRFGTDGALYLSAGDGASYMWADEGQCDDGSDPTLCSEPLDPRNPPVPPGMCGDPPLEGGAFRAQDLLTMPGEALDPVAYNGTILRIDPTTGAAFATNHDSDPSYTSDNRVIAFGLRNPYRFTMRPGTEEIWVGDVGLFSFEEINRIVSPSDSIVENFGWPCREGMSANAQFAGKSFCQTHFAPGAEPSTYTPPFHMLKSGRNENCTTTEADACVPDSEVCINHACVPRCSVQKGNAIVGLAFYEGGSYPGLYNGALFYTDYVSRCIWAMRAGPGGLPDKGQIITIMQGDKNRVPVALERGPNNDLYYVDFRLPLSTGSLNRLDYLGDNTAPVAVIDADPITGDEPLFVSLSGAASYDADGDALSYAWDLDHDGSFDDAIGTDTSVLLTTRGTHRVSLRARDTRGAEAIVHRDIIVGNTAPVVVIASPLPEQLWSVGDAITLLAHATDEEDGVLPASAFAWHVVIEHCSTIECHDHDMVDFSGVNTEVIFGPDHPFSVFIRIEVTATDSLSFSSQQVLRLAPRTTHLLIQTEPPGLDVSLAEQSGSAPMTSEQVVGAHLTLSTAATQMLNGTAYVFLGWSDGGGASHEITIPDVDTVPTATFGAETAGKGDEPPDEPQSPPTDGPDEEEASPDTTQKKTRGCAALSGDPELLLAVLLVVLRSVRCNARDRRRQGGDATSKWHRFGQ